MRFVTDCSRLGGSGPVEGAEGFLDSGAMKCIFSGDWGATGIGMKLLFELVPEAILVFPKIPSSSWYCLRIGSSAELRPVCGSV